MVQSLLLPHRYADSILKIKENGTLQAVAIRSAGNSRIVSEKVVFSKSSMKSIVANQPINKQYEFNGAPTSSRWP